MQPITERRGGEAELLGPEQRGPRAGLGLGGHEQVAAADELVDRADPELGQLLAQLLGQVPEEAHHVVGRAGEPPP